MMDKESTLKKIEKMPDKTRVNILKYFIKN